MSEETKIKILHLTTVKALTSGQRKQLEHEFLAAQEFDFAWHTVALHTEIGQNEFERQIPKFFRPRFLRQIYGWLFAIRNSSRYDLIFMRSLALDLLGPVLGLFVRNRFSVHHSKELEELQLLRHGPVATRVAVGIERYIKPLTMKSARGLAGVTDEIRDYEVSRFPQHQEQAIVLPNGFHFAGTQPVEDKRSTERFTFTFVCGKFTAWHGLDRLLQAIKIEAPSVSKQITVHLVGRLSEAQISEINTLSNNLVEIVAHGMLETEEVSLLLAETDVAIGSLALDRKDLQVASTLKVREYLASGIPVYATHRDTALSADFPYFYRDDSVSINNLIKFAEFTSSHLREEVRSKSRPFLDKGEILQSVVNQLGQIEVIAKDA